MWMTSACADRSRRTGCGDCARVDPCKALARWFGQRPQPRHAEAGEASPFFSFLGEVARAIETSNRKRPPAAAAAPEGSCRRAVELRLEPMLERGPIRIDAVAGALGYSRQTLYRRLKQEGVTFAETLDGLRRRLAIHYVRERGMSVKEAAWRLGFSEPAAFSRAYKRWTGSSPRRLNS